jgi:hypothetical protein
MFREEVYMFVRGQSDEDVLMLLDAGFTNTNQTAFLAAKREVRQRLEEREERIEELEEMLEIKK